ncbi:DUF424 domain-containing protein [Candidatus Alkanophaga liquidiphilum]|nr:MAG: DUF424 domain-containing protein [Candidatus Alkanophagales archaeon]
MFCMKVYKVGFEILVAVCDEELVGKSFSDGFLKLEVSEKFYGRDVVGKDAILKSLRQATIANLVGERAVRLAVENGFVDAENIIFIGGVPHAQMVIMR